jgi:hypothetical protein
VEDGLIEKRLFLPFSPSNLVIIVDNVGGVTMSKIIVTMSLAALLWVLPVQSNAALQPETVYGLKAYLNQIDFSEGVTPATARFSIHVRPGGAFVYGRFGGPGYQKFGHRGYYPQKRGFYPYSKGFYPHKYGRYPTQRYGYNPYFSRPERFYRDGFFSDRYSSRFGYPSTYYSPFGTRRPGW